jgi:uncharacterized protein YebE (UPF0316 family)
MEVLATIPVWLLSIAVFLLRICDVTLGTIRTVSIVKGRITLSVALGFVEVIIWIAVMTQVITRIHESWILAFAWAGGFAAGNALGIVVERRLALGTSVVRIISERMGSAIAEVLRSDGYQVTTFRGSGADGPVDLVYAAGSRRNVHRMVRRAEQIDPLLFYVSEPAYDSSRDVQLRLRPVPHATGWRAVFKKK